MTKETHEKLMNCSRDILCRCDDLHKYSVLTFHAESEYAIERLYEESENLVSLLNEYRKAYEQMKAEKEIV